MRKTLVIAALAAMVSAPAVAVEFSLLGGNTTFSRSSYHPETGFDHCCSGDNVDQNFVQDIDIADRLNLDPDDISSDFNPGVRFGFRVGDDPFLLTVGGRHSDHNYGSVDLGVRFNLEGSRWGGEYRLVHFLNDDARERYGDNDIQIEAVGTVDLFDNFRLGAGVTTATLDDEDVNGLLSFDLVFDLGGKEPAPLELYTPPAPVAPVAPVVPVPAPKEVPSVETTGERG